MLKYAKIVNDATKECSVGVGTNVEFYKSIGMIEMEVEQAWNGAWYVKGYAPQQPHNEAIQAQILELEAQITARNLRGAILGDEYALNMVHGIEEQIEALREELKDL